ncbi:prolyl oligopeptidase family serine peptidase [Mucilaginibacter sp. AW1-3]
MIKRAAYLIATLLFTTAANTFAQDYNLYDHGSYIHKKDTLPYRILFPEHFDPNKKYPLVFVLHGSGERGNDNKSQLIHGAQLFLQVRYREKYPAIVVFPQCPANGSWSNRILQVDANGKEKQLFQVGGESTQAMRMLLGCVDQFLDKPFVDKHKVYIGGLSNGGMGTFEILRRKPDVFAAAFAICGGDNTRNAKVYAQKVPMWIFHGEKDDVVLFQHSLIMVDAIKAAGGHPKFTLYANDGHNSWDDAFAEPELLPWLFSNSK